MTREAVSVRRGARPSQPDELQAPLPPEYQAAQNKAQDDFWSYVEKANISALLTAIVD